jgi:hypothetical protein
MLLSHRSRARRAALTEVRRSFLFVAALAGACLLVALARGAEPDAERDRKARAALALAGAAKPATATAPAPKLAVPKDYSTGYKVATADARPLIVFVGPPDVPVVPVPGAIVAKADSLPGIKAPAAVVTYPVGGKLYVHETLDATKLDPAKLATSVKAATKKVEVAPAPDKLAPKPLDWDVRATPSLDGGARPDCEKCPRCGAKARDVRDSVARVRRDLGDRYAQGSGTVVHSGQGWSLILTAEHVIDGPGTLTVRVGGKTVPAQVVDSDKAADLAVVLIPGDFPAVKVADADVPDGAEVTMYGLTSVFSRGTIAGQETLNGVPNLAYATDADSENGDSGAGVFHEGKLVAVHLGKMGTEKGAKPRAAATGPVRKFIRRALDGGAKPIVPAELPKAEPEPAPKADAPGTLRTTSGRALIPNGNGTYRYADESPAPLKTTPFGAPQCPSGKCPLK